MTLSTSIETLREALAPVEALRGEQSQLESWVRESFATMDALHAELTDWQRDLTRQQAQLDQREAALTEEVRELRRLMERQGVLLERLSSSSHGEEVANGAAAASITGVVE